MSASPPAAPGSPAAPATGPPQPPGLPIEIQASRRPRIKQPRSGRATTVSCAARQYSGGMNLDAVRTFVAAADAGQFQEAAADLSISQQGVSKRIAALEKDLGVRLFTRTARGAELTVRRPGLLPAARELLQAEERAAASVRPGRRALRVDVIGRSSPRGSAAGLSSRASRDRTRCRDPHPGRRRGHRRDPVRAIDAAFRALTRPARQLPGGIEAVRVLDEPVQLLTGPAHELAAEREVTPARLAGHRIWMPGIVTGTERRRTTTSSPPRSGSASTRPTPASAPNLRWTRWPAPRPWPPSSASRPAWSGPPTMTCGASPCTSRPRSTRTH